LAKRAKYDSPVSTVSIVTGLQPGRAGFHARVEENNFFFQKLQNGSRAHPGSQSVAAAVLSG